MQRRHLFRAAAALAAAQIAALAEPRRSAADMAMSHFALGGPIPPGRYVLGEPLDISPRALARWTEQNGHKFAIPASSGARAVTWGRGGT